eukprot:11601899-Alexandrium_andersonii.AAC.1
MPGFGSPGGGDLHVGDHCSALPDAGGAALRAAPLASGLAEWGSPTFARCACWNRGPLGLDFGAASPVLAGG